jgi:heme-degrading monooxygenase HmoA
MHTLLGVATLITALEDEASIAGRDEATTLHRALRTDVDFRFVAVGEVEAGGYEVLREAGTPDIEGGVVRIELFAVPSDDDARFLAGWQRLRDALAQQRGYLGTRLYRSVAAADFRFVDITRWSSPLMVARALKLDEVQAAIDALRFRSHAALYLAVTG